MQTNLVVSIALNLLIKSLWDYSVRFCSIAENSLCGKHKLMTLVHFVQQRDNQTSSWSYDFNVTSTKLPAILHYIFYKMIS